MPYPKLSVHLFTPLPPAATAIADCVAQLLAPLAERCQLVVWTNQDEVTELPGIDVRRFTEDGPPAAELARADAIFYQIGNNAPFHSAIFEVFRRFGGIVILHDVCLQHFFHARAAAGPRWREEYVGAMRRHHGAAGETAALAALRDGRLVQEMAARFPLTGMMVESAEAVVTHNPAELAALRALHGNVVHIPLAVDFGKLPARPKGRRTGRLRLVMAGHLGGNRGLAEVLEAVAAPDLCDHVALDIYGEMVPQTAIALRKLLASHPLGSHLRCHGRVGEAELVAALARADLALNLRKPTMGEASASQLRFWAHALPSVVSRTGWYATLPEDTVLFVEPGDEVEGIRRHLRAALATPGCFAALGAKGRQRLHALHTPAACADAMLELARGLRAPEVAVAAGPDASHAGDAPAVLHGYLDRQDAAELRGWAWRSDLPEQRVNVSLILDGALVDEVEATEFRPDVMAAGHGDGCYGFTLRLPPGAGRTAHLQAVAHEGEIEAVLLDSDARAAPLRLPTPATRSWNTLHVDLTDLLAFMSQVAHVTGIQRVQLGYLVTLLQERSATFCCFSTERREFFSLARADVVWLVRACSGHEPDDLAARQQRIAAMARGDARPAIVVADGDVLLGTGCFWSFLGWFDTVRGIKQRHALRYVQLVYDAVPMVAAETTVQSQVDPFSRAMSNLLLMADALLTISHATMRDLRGIAGELQLRLPPGEVVQLGGATSYGRRAAGPDAEAAGEAAPFGLHDYVLCVGTIEPRKNHIYLYHLWKRLLAWPQGGVPQLVFAGRWGWHTEELQRHLAATGNLDGMIVILPQVSDAELRALYRNCRFTIFPSLYEGWGLPVSESFAAGKLCVASAKSSIPEAGGDWAIYIDPYNVEDGVRTVSRLLADPALVAAREAEIRGSYRVVSWPEATQGVLDALVRLMRAVPGALLAPPVLALDECLTPPPMPDAVSPMVIARRELQRIAFAALLEPGEWHDAEAHNVWAAGPSAGLRFVLPEGVGPVLCYLRVRLPPWYGSQQLAVMLDGVLATQAVVSALAAVVPVPIAAGGEHRIELRLGATIAAPPEIGDGRRLGVGLADVQVVEAGDLLARLSYLERALLRG